MNLKTAFQTIVILLLVMPIVVTGQISRGGTPIQIQKLKSYSSNTTDLVVMPAVDNVKMRGLYSRTDQNKLKPFRFAYSFDVSLNLNNSGTWYNTTQVNVWQLRIRSTGAYSLNLIFDQFNLPENARLFLISENTGEIKGAYTSDNNSESRMFAVEPIEGDELLIQYEEPVNVPFRGELQIAKVAHDYVGIVTKDHRPLGISGPCNVNVNCDIANGTENVRDGICRIIIDGSELCTGTMLNNTSKDGAPYVLTAFHCFQTSNNSKPSQSQMEKMAQSALFLFNYESPYCGTIDGDVSHSLSGSTVKASFDSLDFALVRLNNTPTANYRPYLLGWNRKNIAPSSSISIHHPLGDIKKISIDNDPAITAKFNSSYLTNGFWKVLRWDYGVTEEGSSGGPLLDQNKQLIGSLTGGSASCPPGLPTNDYFEKFALAWDYRTESSKQLKIWLDPINSNVEKLDGMALNPPETHCSAVTNFKDTDTHSIVKIPDVIIKKGYYSGSNSAGFTEFAEQFKFSKSCELSGISLGIAKVKLATGNSTSYISVRVYEGTDKPERLLVDIDKFYLKNFYGDAMNYLSFTNPVKTTGNFFVSYDISKINAGDSLVVYMANRKSDVTNSFFLKNNSAWSTYNSLNLEGNGSALLSELIACNINDTASVDTTKSSTLEARFYPNPLSGNTTLHIETIETIDTPEDIAVYDLLGKKQNVTFTQTGLNKMSLNFNGKRAGIYFIHLQSGGKKIIGKVAYLP